MKKRLYLIANGKTRRIVAWNARRDERDGMLHELNRCAPGQYVAGLLTIDTGITLGGDPAEFFEPEDLFVPPPYRPDFEEAKRQIMK